jgi:hypothetical protein
VGRANKRVRLHVRVRFQITSRCDPFVGPLREFWGGPTNGSFSTFVYGLR